MTVSFPVDSRKVDVTGFRPLMEALSEACYAQGLDFFIIGALARDLVLIHLHELQPRRLTRDADVAVAVATWDDYKTLAKTLTRDYGFQEGDERQRLVAPGGALLDLIPFGAIEAERREIRWPPEEAFAMSTLGFREAYHLGYEKHDPAGRGSGNSRNGHGRKMLQSDSGPVEISVPRDHKGDFEPKLVPKRQSRIPSFDEKVTLLYARGMTTREIQGHLEELYGTEISPTLISNVTSAVLDEVTAWHARPRSVPGSFNPEDA